VFIYLYSSFKTVVIICSRIAWSKYVYYSVQSAKCMSAAQRVLAAEPSENNVELSENCDLLRSELENVLELCASGRKYFEVSSFNTKTSIV